MRGGAVDLGLKSMGAMLEPERGGLPVVGNWFCWDCVVVGLGALEEGGFGLCFRDFSLFMLTDFSSFWLI